MIGHHSLQVSTVRGSHSAGQYHDGKPLSAGQYHKGKPLCRSVPRREATLCVSIPWWEATCNRLVTPRKVTLCRFVPREGATFSKSVPQGEATQHVGTTKEATLCRWVPRWGATRRSVPWGKPLSAGQYHWGSHCLQIRESHQLVKDVRGYHERHLNF